MWCVLWHHGGKKGIEEEMKRKGDKVNKKSCEKVQTQAGRGDKEHWDREM